MREHLSEKFATEGDLQFPLEAADIGLAGSCTVNMRPKVSERGKFSCRDLVARAWYVEFFHLPPSYTFNPAASDPRCSASGETVTCPLGTLPVDGSTNEIVIAFFVGPEGSYTVAASIIADQPDEQMSTTPALTRNTSPADPGRG